MKRKTLLSLFVTFAAGLMPRPAIAQTADQSLKNEVQIAIDKGIKYLKSKQDAAGFFGSDEQTAFTALAAMAIMGDPSVTGKPMPEEAKKAYAWILSMQKPDGGIYKGITFFSDRTSPLSRAVKPACISSTSAAHTNSHAMSTGRAIATRLLRRAR